MDVGTCKGDKLVKVFLPVLSVFFTLKEFAGAYCGFSEMIPFRRRPGEQERREVMKIVSNHKNAGRSIIVSILPKATYSICLGLC